jgi:ornithine decarboxylase
MRSKANPASEIIRTLAALGSSFDLASPREVDLCLRFGASPEKFSYDNCTGETARRLVAHRRVHTTRAAQGVPAIQGRCGEDAEIIETALVKGCSPFSAFLWKGSDVIAECRLMQVIVGGIAIGMLGLASIAAADANATAAHSGRLASAAASSGIPMYENSGGIPIDYRPATLPIDPPD